jgi:hypothetical protein
MLSDCREQVRGFQHNFVRTFLFTGLLERHTLDRDEIFGLLVACFLDCMKTADSLCDRKLISDTVDPSYETMRNPPFVVQHRGHDGRLQSCQGWQLLVVWQICACVCRSPPDIISSA